MSIGVYDAAEAYALAFSYRDIPAEVDAVLGFATGVLGRCPTSVLELAAGPADHARELARRGLHAIALDLSDAMNALATRSAAVDRVALDTLTADMRQFVLAEPVELALLMIDSAAHLLTEGDLDGHLRCVASSLVTGGCYVIELSHPDDSLGDEALTVTSWSMCRDDATVQLRWGDPDVDEYDEASRITTVSVSLDYEVAGQPALSISERLPQRKWTLGELDASTARAGGLTRIATYGSFQGMSLDDRQAWRAIAVLRRD